MALKKILAATAVAALFAAGSANAQLFGEEYGTDLDYDRFEAGFGETGVFDAWNVGDDEFLDEGEFATGIYADWDVDNDLQITEEEFGLGAERWYGDDYDVGFADWDADESGFIDRAEFGGAWDTAYYEEWDVDDDELLSDEEFSTGLYGAADYDEDKIITVEEEGWFDGWFDGDDIEVDVQEVGEVL